MPGRIYTDILTINDTNWYAVVVDPNGLLTAPIGSIATLKTAPMVWVNADGATTWDVVYPVVIPPGADTPVLGWGNGSVSATVTTRYLSPWYDDSLAQTIPVRWRVPRAGTIRSMRVRHNVTAGNGNAIVYTLRVNGVATLLSVSLASTATDGSDLVDSIAVADGDLIDIEVTKALAVGTSPSDIALVVEFA